MHQGEGFECRSEVGVGVGSGEVQGHVFTKFREPICDCQGFEPSMKYRGEGKLQNQTLFTFSVESGQTKYQACVTWMQSRWNGCSFAMNKNLFFISHMLSTHSHRPRVATTPLGSLQKEREEGGRGSKQCCLRDNVTFLFIKILCQLLGK